MAQSQNPSNKKTTANSKSKSKTLLFLALAGITGIAITATAFKSQDEVLALTAGKTNNEVITVYKSPTCGCCKKWITHLEDNGFKVKAIDSNDMASIKDQQGVPMGARSCHTAVINNYVIEGHVPAQDIKNLLKEKRTVAGLAVPGMPMGSPGMEGSRVDNYMVYEFDKTGHAKIVSKY